MLDTREISVDGIRTGVYEAGVRSRSDAIVFIHGNPGPLDDWEDIAPHASELGRVVALDMPGFGRAERPRSFEYSVAGYARFLASALAQLGVARAHLVMHDFGGAWGARWALDHPHALCSVTLISTPLCPNFRWHLFAKAWQTRGLGELVHLVTGPRLITAVMNRDNPRPLPHAFTERVTNYYDWAQGRAVDRLYRASRDAHATFAPLAAGLKALDPPACIIWGARDKYAPVRHADSQARLFRRSELHVIDDAGHWPFIDEPAQTRAIITSFLRSVMDSR